MRAYFIRYNSQAHYNINIPIHGKVSYCTDHALTFHYEIIHFWRRSAACFIEYLFCFVFNPNLSRHIVAVYRTLLLFAFFLVSQINKLVKTGIFVKRYNTNRLKDPLKHQSSFVWHHRMKYSETYPNGHLPIADTSK